MQTSRAARSTVANRSDFDDAAQSDAAGLRREQRLAALLWTRGDLLQAADIAVRAQLCRRRKKSALAGSQWALRVGDELRAREYLRQTGAKQPGESAEEAAPAAVVLDGGDEPANRRRTLENRLTQVSTGLSSIETLRQLLILCATKTIWFPSNAMLGAAFAGSLDGLGLTALTDCLIATGRSQESVFSAASDKPGISATRAGAGSAQSVAYQTR